MFFVKCVECGRLMLAPPIIRDRDIVVMRVAAYYCGMCRLCERCGHFPHNEPCTRSNGTNRPCKCKAS